MDVRVDLTCILPDFSPFPSSAQIYVAFSSRGLACARHNVRLREFVPSCGRHTTTYTGKDTHTLADCGLAPAKAVVLETRPEGKVCVCFFLYS